MSQAAESVRRYTTFFKKLYTRWDFLYVEMEIMDLVRVSAGIEDPEDIIDDFRQALDAL